jgi:hypothetical protein
LGSVFPAAAVESSAASSVGVQADIPFTDRQIQAGETALAVRIQTGETLSAAVAHTANPIRWWALESILALFVPLAESHYILLLKKTSASPALMLTARIFRADNSSGRA